MCQTTNQISTQSWSLQNLQAVNAAALGGWGPSAFSASSPSGTSMGGDDDMALRWLNVFSRFFPAVSGCFFVFSDALVHLPKKNDIPWAQSAMTHDDPSDKATRWPLWPTSGPKTHRAPRNWGSHQAQVGWFIAFKPWIPKSPVKNELFIHPIVGFLRFSASPRDTPFWCLILPPSGFLFFMNGANGANGALIGWALAWSHPSWDS